MWPLFTFDVRPLKLPVYVNTFVAVSSVAVNVPVPVGLPKSPGGSPDGESATWKWTTVDFGGVVVLSLPHAMRIAKVESVRTARTRFCMVVLLAAGECASLHKCWARQRRIPVGQARFRLGVCVPKSEGARRIHPPRPHSSLTASR